MKGTFAKEPQNNTMHFGAVKNNIGMRGRSAQDGRKRLDKPENFNAMTSACNTDALQRNFKAERAIQEVTFRP